MRNSVRLWNMSRASWRPKRASPAKRRGTVGGQYSIGEALSRELALPQLPVEWAFAERELLEVAQEFIVDERTLVFGRWMLVHAFGDADVGHVIGDMMLDAVNKNSLLGRVGIHRCSGAGDGAGYVAHIFSAFDCSPRDLGEAVEALIRGVNVELAVNDWPVLPLLPKDCWPRLRCWLDWPIPRKRPGGSTDECDATLDDTGA